jgi:membrane protein DedA with SNARE-associated domain
MPELLVTHGSYLLISFVLALTGAGLPIPEEVPILTAGIMASQGQLNPWLAFVACLAGALVGDCIMYGIGYQFGRSVVREHRYWAVLVTPQREAQMEEMISRHGLKVLFLARFLVLLRSPVYLTAGILKLPFRRFFLFDLVCATIVIGVFFSLSYFFGQAATPWIRRVEILVTLVVVVAVLAVVGVGFYFWRSHQRRVAEQAATAQADVAKCDSSEPDNSVPSENNGSAASKTAGRNGQPESKDAQGTHIEQVA